MKTENLKILIICSLLLSGIALFVSVQNKGVQLGGYTAGHWDSANGYKVDGTTVIDGDGNIDGTITTDTITASGESQLQTVISGGATITLVTSSTDIVLTAAQVCDSSVIAWTPIGAKNMTFPTSALINADCLDADGDTKTFLFRNEAEAASTTTMVAGTDMVLLEPDGQNVVIAGGQSALVTMVRITPEIVLVIVDEMLDAD